MADDRIPVLLDTDIGANIDDALALAYLLSEPRCELAGVTTVGGDVGQRAALAQVLCEAAGRGDAPVHCGATGVLLDGPGRALVPQYETVRDLPHRRDWLQATAVDFMRRVVHDRPGEVTLLSIGPLTNVALLFALDPETPRLLRSWVSMAGNFAPDAPPETNARTDPTATAMAFRAPVQRHLHLGYDVTSRCRLPAAEVRHRLGSTELTRLVLRLAESWFSVVDEVVFHDPLAAYAIFDEPVIDTRRGSVTVDASTGRTSFDANATGRDEVAVGVKSDTFFESFFKVLAG